MSETKDETTKVVVARLNKEPKFRDVQQCDYWMDGRLCVLPMWHSGPHQHPIQVPVRTKDQTIARLEAERDAEITRLRECLFAAAIPLEVIRLVASEDEEFLSQDLLLSVVEVTDKIRALLPKPKLLEGK